MWLKVKSELGTSYGVSRNFARHFPQVGMAKRSRGNLYGVLPGDGEVKFVDDGQFTSTMATALSSANGDPTTRACLNAMAQGDGDSERVGRRIVMKSLELQGNIGLHYGDSAAFVGTYARMVVYLDKQTNGVQSTPDEVYTAGTGASVNAYPDLAQSGRFKILVDKWVDLTPGGFSWNGTVWASLGSKKHFRVHVDLNDMEANFTGTGGTVANIVDNSIHVFFVCSSSFIDCTMQYSSRLRYVG